MSIRLQQLRSITDVLFDPTQWSIIITNNQKFHTSDVFNLSLKARQKRYLGFDNDAKLIIHSLSCIVISYC